MLIIIKPYKESTSILRFHVEKVLACMIFHTSGILESIERFHSWTRFIVEKWASSRGLWTQNKGLHCKVIYQKRQPERFISKPEAWNRDMQLYGYSVVYFGRVIFVNFKIPPPFISVLQSERLSPIHSIYLCLLQSVGERVKFGCVLNSII